VRYPGSPDDQAVTADDVKINIAEDVSATVYYTPRANGDTPTWLTLTYEDGTNTTLFRSFNNQKPEEWVWVIDMNEHITGQPIHFEGSVYDPGTDDIDVTWDFGDGSIPITTHYLSNGNHPMRITEHKVRSFAYGVYTVSLQAVDDDSGSGSMTVTITNTDRLTSTNVAPRASSSGGMAVLEDGLVTLTGTGDDTGSDQGILTYTWDLGDGTVSTDPIVTHVYTKAGFYYPTLVVADDEGAIGICSELVEVSNVVPTAVANADNVILAEDDTINLDAFSSSDTPTDSPILQYAWDYGDGSKGYGESTSHVYTKTGLYTVTLTVQDNDGAISTDTLLVDVSNPAPYDLILTAKATVDEDELIFFGATALDTPTDESLLTYVWDFGDGNAGSGTNPTHSYDEPGTYLVEVTVTDDDSSSVDANTTVIAVNVQPAAFAGPTILTVYGPAITLDFEGRGFDTFSDQPSLTYTWDLGGGTFVYTPTASKHLSATGIYDISFHVTDVHLSVSTTIQIKIDFTLDSDGDQLTDEEELVEGTDPFAWDTDGDNLTDYWEVYDYPTDPLLPDTDFDYLNDWYEITFFGLTDPDEDGLVNPVDWDSDGDWIIDGLDVHPLLYTDTDGSVLFWDAIKVRNDIGYGVSVVMYGGTCSVKPTIGAATPPAPLEGAVGVYANIDSTCTPPFNAQIRMRYDESAIPSGLEEEWFRIMYWSTTENKWKWIVDSGVDTTHNFVWAKVTEFSIFGIADIGLQDFDEDGLINKVEFTTLYDAEIVRTGLNFNIYRFPNPLYIKNDRTQIQIPRSKIYPASNGAFGIVDLFVLGFVPADFEVKNTWKLTNGWGTEYYRLYTTVVYDAQSASLTFRFLGIMKYMKIDITGKTDPFDPDTDDDGVWDGTEVNKYRTNPIDPDTDNDRVVDGTDIDPLIDLKVTVNIKEILQIDQVDSTFLYQEKADFYVKVKIAGEWFTSPKPGEWNNNPHRYPGWKFTKNVPDNVENVNVIIELWDQDWGSADDKLDISRSGPALDLTYNLKTGMWSGEDAIADGDQGRSGYGHASGREDGSHGYDNNDQEIWFDIYQSDYDGDKVAFWEEVNPDPVNFQKRRRGDYYSGGALYVKNDRAKYRIPSEYIKRSGNKYYGTVELFDIGFNKDDFATGNTWRITGRWWREYVYVKSTMVVNAESASLYFEVFRYQYNHYMSIDVSYFTDPTVYNWDTDSDGMPDWWELRFGLNRLNANDATNDPDGDNLGNKAEYNWDTDPTFFEVNLVVDINFDASESYIKKYVKGMKLASDYLFDVTDGYMYFRTVFIRDKTNSTTSDIVVEPGVPSKDGYAWPHTYVGGISSSTVQIVMPQKFDDSGLGWGILAVNPDNGKYYRTIAHEFGHYGLYLYDEYEDANGKSYPCILGIGCGPASLMNRAKAHDELTTPTQYASWWKPWGFGMPEHWVLSGNKSCWETFFETYKDTLWFDLDHNGAKDTTFLDSYTAYGGPSVGGPYASIPGGFTKVEWINS